jgi:hypothetical protein
MIRITIFVLLLSAGVFFLGALMEDETLYLAPELGTHAAKPVTYVTTTVGARAGWSAATVQEPAETGGDRAGLTVR